MKKRTQLVVMMGLSTSLLAGAALAQGSSGSMTQSPSAGLTGMPASSGSSGMSPSGSPSMSSSGGSAVAGDAGSISNVESTQTSTSTSLSDDTGALPNTGGEPWMMLLAGSLTAGGAFLLRRKLA